MSIPPLNVLDGLIIITFGWNSLKGFSRGFLVEVVSLIGFFLSLALAFLGTPLFVKQFFPSAITSQVVALGVATFLISFIFFKYLAVFLNKKLSDTSFSFLNNLLGLLFGIAKGYVTVAVLVLGVSYLAPESYLIKKSHLGGMVVPLVDRVIPFVPTKVQKDVEKSWKTAKVYLWQNFKRWKEVWAELRPTPQQKP